MGRKPPTNYVLAVATAFNESNAKKVVLKAREISNKAAMGEIKSNMVDRNER